jgi:hypothetical protein
MSKVALSSQVSTLLSSGQSSGVKTHQEKGGNSAFAEHNQSEDKAAFMGFVENCFQTSEIQNEKPTNPGEGAKPKGNSSETTKTKSPLLPRHDVTLSAPHSTHTVNEKEKEAKTVLSQQSVFSVLGNPMAAVQTAIPQEAGTAYVEKTQSSISINTDALNSQAAKNSSGEVSVASDINQNQSGLSTYNQSHIPLKESESISNLTMENSNVFNSSPTKQHISADSNSTIESGTSNVLLQDAPRESHNASGLIKGVSKLPRANNQSESLFPSSTTNAKSAENTSGFPSSTTNAKSAENTSGFSPVVTQPIQNIDLKGKAFFSGHPKADVVQSLKGPAIPKENQAALVVNPSSPREVSNLPKAGSSDTVTVAPVVQHEVLAGSPSPVGIQENLSPFVTNNTPFLMQLSQVRLLSDGTYNMSAVLTPPELGKVEAEVKMSNGVLSVAITSHNAKTNALLLQHGQEIAESLQTNPSNVSFSLRQEQNGNSSGSKPQASFSVASNEETFDSNEEVTSHGLYLGTNSLHIVL